MSSTSKILNELISSNDITKVVEKHEEDFVEGNFQDFFAEMLLKYGIKRLDVINRANISVSYGYQMLDGTKKPKRDKIIQLCFGFPLNLEEIQLALRFGGVNALYAKCKRDAYILFAASKGYSLEMLNKLLYEVGEPEIGSAE